MTQDGQTEVVRKKIQPLPKKTAAPKKTAQEKYKEKVEADHARLTETTPANLPSSFAALHKDQLIAAAQYFGTVEEGSEELIRADLEDAGVTWAEYCHAFKLPVPEGADQPVDFPEPVDDWDEKEGEEVTDIVTVQEAPALAADSKYLVKFIGKNPYFEFRRYKFTADKPYAIMPAADAQDVLESEPTKFRQAFPKELQEFYS